MFLELVLLLRLWMLPVAAHRPHQMFSLSLPEGREDLEKNVHKEEDEFTVTIRRNGKNRYGFLVDPGTGRIRMVTSGSPADMAGLKAGPHIIAVGARPYTYRALRKACSKNTCQVTVATSKFPSAMASAFRFLNLTAAFAGVLILLSLPCIIRQTGTCEPDAFAHPAILSIVSVSIIGCCGELGISLLDWPYANLARKIGGVAHCVGCLGLAGGCLANRQNPLLNVPLDKEQSEAFRHASLLALVLFLLRAVSTMSWAFWSWNESGGVLDTIYCFRYLPESILFCIFTSLMGQISIAASQGMADIAKALSHGTVDFLEQVHKPCSKLLEEVPPNLARCGLPLMVISLASMTDTVPFIHQQLMEMWSWPPARNFSSCCYLARAVSWLVAAVCPLTVSLGQLSSGLKRLEAELNEYRMRNPSQHLQVLAVEEMLAEARGTWRGLGGLVRKKGIKHQRSLHS
eukprot:Skav220317  [mRNA]  locus=scaffold972:41020:42396:- [translate_table: standard]